MPMKSTFLSIHLVLCILITKLAITGASIKSRLWLNDIDLSKLTTLYLVQLHAPDEGALEAKVSGCGGG